MVLFIGDQNHTIWDLRKVEFLKKDGIILVIGEIEPQLC